MPEEGITIVMRRDRGNTTQTSTRPVSEEACKQRTPRWGLKRADGLTQVDRSEHRRSSVTGWAHSPHNKT